ncbi:hypothetical protein KY361_04035 [Candidatus Woesearchaeota archaeon]|nr:hypothetical protein [Candidatus Woesearchaeota archaeon]
MQKELVIKVLSILLIVVVVTNLTLFVMKKINQTLFWTIIIIAALIAYKGIPKLKSKK